MERIQFVNSRNLRLTGTFYPGHSDAVVILVHGFTSDRRSNGRFEYIARCLTDAGYQAFAFDFCGCGESDHEVVTTAGQIDDLASAVALMVSRGATRVALWGNSLGGRICLQANPQEAATMVLTGAPVGPLQYRWEEIFSEEQMTELQEEGTLTVRRDDGLRDEVIVDASVLADFASFDAQPLLGTIRCPVLLVHGDGDEEERRLLELARRALPLLPGGSRLEVIPRARHGFFLHIDRVMALGLEWLKRTLPISS